MKKLSVFLLALITVFSLVIPGRAAEALASVADSISQLPTAEEFLAMDPDAQLDAYNRTQAAYDAWISLSEAERAEIPEAEVIFDSLFSCFNALVMPIAEGPAPQPTTAAPQPGPGGKVGYNSFAWIVIVLLVAVLILAGKKKKH